MFARTDRFFCLFVVPMLMVSSSTAVALGPPGLPGATESERAVSSSTTIEELDHSIRQLDADVKRQGSVWMLEIDGMALQIIADERHDRMRIVAPVARLEDVSAERLMRCMEANFSTALDARYAVDRGVLWSVFLHPLGSLDERLLRSAVGQTITLARNYGTTFRSGALRFGGAGRAEPGIHSTPRIRVPR